MFVSKLKAFWSQYSLITIFVLCVVGIVWWTVSSQPYQLGHDIYFHLDAAEFIQTNGLRIPETIPYYWKEFLFGYPPLFHFLTALIATFSGAAVSTVFSYSVPILFFGAIMSVFWLYKSTGHQNPLLLNVLYTFSMIDLLWPLYSGEYPRLLGFILAVMSITMVIHANRSQNKRLILLLISGVFGALAAMTNMIACLIIGILLLYLGISNYYQTKKWHSFLPLVVTIVASSPWWLRAMSLYGWRYFYDVLTIHGKAPFTTVTTIGLVLLFIYWIYKKKKFPSIFGLWLIVGISTSGTPFVFVPIVYYLYEFGKPLMIKISADLRKVAFAALYTSTLVLLALITSGTVFMNHNYMKADVAEAGTWIKSNTSPTIKIIAYGAINITKSNTVNHGFATITGMYRDDLIPYWSDRKAYTWFGYEWSVDPERYPKYWKFHEKLCVDHLVSTADTYDIYPDVIWLNKDSQEIQDPNYFCDNLEQPMFRTIYENETIKLIRVNWDLYHTTGSTSFSEKECDC